jgi:hypothetical protein
MDLKKKKLIIGHPKNFDFFFLQRVMFFVFLTLAPTSHSLVLTSLVPHLIIQFLNP